MGGHGNGHGHHEPPYKVPNASIYKVENARELVYLRDELAKRGLKDPWIRNEVWRYNTKFWGNRRTRLLNVMFTGIQWGLPLAIATIAYEEYFDVYNKHSHGHGHGDDASAGHH